MSSKEIVLTRHARLARERRGIARDWIKQAVAAPDQVTFGRGAGTERRRRQIEGAPNKSLVVVMVEEPRQIRVITLYLLAS